MTRPDLPESYRGALRTVIRYAVIMAIVGLLVGISFHESIIQLALVHGHVFVMGVLLPLALAGALLMARRAGGRDLSPRGLAWLVRGYLPLAAASLALHLYKGYHVLLMARAGERDFAVIDQAFLGGSHVLRYGVYAVVHTGMGVALGVFLVLLWRSLGRAD